MQQEQEDIFCLHISLDYLLPVGASILVGGVGGGLCAGQDAVEEGDSLTEAALDGIVGVYIQNGVHHTHLVAESRTMTNYTTRYGMQ